MSGSRHIRAGGLLNAAGGVTANQAVCFLSGAALALLLQSALKPAGCSPPTATRIRAQAPAAASPAAAPAAAAPRAAQDGWKTIDVYVGKSTFGSPAKWNAQNGQDKIVAELLNQKRGGYFVDLAANDAVFISNTYSLESNLGWTGLCIEANKWVQVIDYLSLDVEGAEGPIMQHFPFDEYTFLIITAERPKPPLVARLEAHGYTAIAGGWPEWERVFVHKTVPGYDAIVAKYPAARGR